MKQCHDSVYKYTPHVMNNKRALNFSFTRKTCEEFPQLIIISEKNSVLIRFMLRHNAELSHINHKAFISNLPHKVASSHKFVN